MNRGLTRPDVLVTVCSLKGLVTSMMLEQQAQRAENEALWAEVRQHMEMQSTLLAELSASSSHGRQRRSHKAAVQAAAAIPAPAHQIAGPPSLPSLCLQTGPSLPHTTMPNFTINISGTPATNSSIGTLVPTVSHPTNFALPSFGADQPLAIDTSSSDPRSEKWAALLTKYGRDKLDTHKWKWKNGDWLPRYRYQPVDAIMDIWTKYVDGLNGHLSMQELKDRWGAKWRCNEGSLKTEAARHSKVVSLVEQLSARPNWNVSLALRFLVEKYENASAFVGKVRAFCDYLQRDGGAGFQAVIAAALYYPS
ncbi:hypothetical protein F4604DRAFT_1925037 [Suillus subluteus]|nr:hypothetical protein F4604DRAFT_1925037 [Suillus subluteus]